MSESELIKEIDKCLSVRNMTGEVEWYSRLNSGRVRTVYGSYIRLCEEGTPDFLAIIRNKEKNLTVLFIEAKGQGGKLRTEQIRFAEIHNKKKDFKVIKITDIADLKNIINELAIDTVNEDVWPMLL